MAPAVFEDIGIVPAAAFQGVVARTAIDDVGAVVALQSIVPAAAGEVFQPGNAARRAAINVGSRSGHQIHRDGMGRAVTAVIQGVGARTAIQFAAQLHAVGGKDEVVVPAAAGEVLEGSEIEDARTANVAAVVFRDVPGRVGVLADEGIAARAADDLLYLVIACANACGGLGLAVHGHRMVSVVEVPIQRVITITAVDPAVYAHAVAEDEGIVARAALQIPESGEVEDARAADVAAVLRCDVPGRAGIRSG